MLSRQYFLIFVSWRLNSSWFKSYRNTGWPLRNESGATNLISHEQYLLLLIIILAKIVEVSVNSRQKVVNIAAVIFARKVNKS